MNTGPVVIMGTKRPSITSKWTAFIPAPSSKASSELRCIRSADRIPALMVGEDARRREKALLADTVCLSYLLLRV